ncbi:MAG: protoporphyrinogen oxidase [Gammaproteobacteria bacterium]
MKIIIVGGGISGLATAYYLLQRCPDCEVTVLEQEPCLGGTMRTEQKDGYLFELGANGFLSNRPDTLELVEAVGAEDLLLRSSDDARKRFVFTDRLYPLPETPGAFLRTALLKPRDKLRVLAEPFIAARRDDQDESLQSFGYRRVGKAFTDTFLDAMAAGIHASTPEKLSVQAAFPAVVRLEQEFGGLFKGMLKKRSGSAGPRGVLMSFRGGVARFIEQLAHTTGATVRTDCAIAQVRRTRAGFVVEGRGLQAVADKVILATPAFVAGKLLKAIDGELAEWLGAIEYSPIAVVGFGYARLRHPLGGFGLLTTQSAEQDILGILWDSSIFPDRAPPGEQCLRVLIGGQRAPSLVHQEEGALIEIALRGIEATMGVRESPAVTIVKRWQRGIPHYKVGHGAQVSQIFARLKQHGGLYLNSNAYYGVGLNDCVTNSKRCAQVVAVEGV